MEAEDKFKKYQCITAPVACNPSDPRPETYRIDCDCIEVGELVSPDSYEWSKRQDILFAQPSWQFTSVDGEGGLLEAQTLNRTSLAVVEPREILKVDLFCRAEEECISFEQKQEELRKQNAAERANCLFEEFMPPEMKSLAFVRNRVRVKWLCRNSECPGHSMEVLDWEVTELQRKKGDEVALQAVQEHLNQDEYAVRFFLGNMLLHPTRFSIVGIWYPERAKGLLFA
jgi:hypothetical protein